MLVRYLYKDFLQGRTILTNMGSINSFKNMPLSIESVLDLDEENKQLQNVTIGIDELTVYVDCRVSGAKKNRAFSYFILQSRKRNVNVYYTTQDLNMIDLRVRQHTHIIINCNFIYDNDGDIVEDWRNYTVIDFRQPMHPKTMRFDLNIAQYFKVYDTNEIIRPIE